MLKGSSRSITAAAASARGRVDELAILAVAGSRAVDEHVAVGGDAVQIGAQAVELRHQRGVRDQDRGRPSR